MQILIGIISSLMLVGAFCILLGGWEEKKPTPQIETRPMRYEDYEVLFGGDIINYHQRKQR